MEFTQPLKKAIFSSQQICIAAALSCFFFAVTWPVVLCHLDAIHCSNYYCYCTCYSSSTQLLQVMLLFYINHGVSKKDSFII